MRIWEEEWNRDWPSQETLELIQRVDLEQAPWVYSIHTGDRQVREGQDTTSPSLILSIAVHDTLNPNRSPDVRGHSFEWNLIHFHSRVMIMNCLNKSSKQ